MSGSIVPVKAGRTPTQISGSDLRDTTIYNTSSTQAVWIGNSVALVPNQGMRIGPLGTAKWAKEAGLAYACVDTGVATPINLNVSNDITDPTNPVDVATAVATALLAQGIPNVLVSTVLVDQVLGAGVAKIIDVSAYASLVVYASGSAINTDIAMNVLAYDSTASFNNEESFDLTAPVALGGDVAYGKWIIPVTQPEMQFFPYAASSDVELYVAGTNRVAPRMYQLIRTYLPRILSCNQAFVANTPIQLLSADIYSDNCTRYNGPVKVSLANNAAAAAATYTIRCTYVGINGRLNVRIFPIVGPNITIDFYHPPVPCIWEVVPVAGGAACVVNMQIAPAGSGQ